MFNVKTKKGSVLAYSLIVMFMLLSIALIISKTSTISLQNSITTTKSVQAVQIAESGSQLAKSKIISLRSTATTTIKDLKDPTLPGANCDGSGKITGAAIAGGTYDVAFYKSDGSSLDCLGKLSDVKTIQVQGTKGDVTRAIEVSIPEMGTFTKCGDDIKDKNWNGTTNTLIYKTVSVTHGGKQHCWLKSNLGTTEIDATKVSSYGWYFQWGRGADGHQVYCGDGTCSGANICKTLNLSDGYYTNCKIGTAPNLNPDGLFRKIIFDLSVNAGDWLLPHDSNLWTSTGGANNPCPTGFHVPTLTGDSTGELGELSYLLTHPQGAVTNPIVSLDVATPLSMPKAGAREYSGQTFAAPDYQSRGSSYCYWSSTTSGNESYALNIDGSKNPKSVSSKRALGCSVRCIQDAP